METDVKTIVIAQPDDWHCHFRDGELLSLTTSVLSPSFGRVLAMPNLVPPVSNATMAHEYHSRIGLELERGHEPGDGAQPDLIMTLYLTDETTVLDLEQVAKSDRVHAIKLYPRHATTNSDFGVVDPLALGTIFDKMTDLGIPLLLHGEVTDPNVDIFDREAVFIDRILEPLRKRHPDLRLVLEHITTSTAVDYVLSSSGGVHATITPHHLEINRNAMFAGGIRPHYFCLPVAKREKHRQALVQAATSGSSYFFAGTDSAPHTVERKESSCGCAGIFNSPVAVPCYAEVFDNHGKIDLIENFLSVNGARFYGMEVNKTKVALHRKPWRVPDRYDLPSGASVIPYRAGEELQWRVESMS